MKNGKYSKHDGFALYCSLLVLPFPVIYCWFETILILRQPAEYSFTNYLIYITVALCALGCLFLVLRESIRLLRKNWRVLIGVFLQCLIACFLGSLVGGIAMVAMCVHENWKFSQNARIAFDLFWVIGTIIFIPVRLNASGILSYKDFFLERADSTNEET